MLLSMSPSFGRAESQESPTQLVLRSRGSSMPRTLFAVLDFVAGRAGDGTRLPLRDASYFKPIVW